MKKMISTVLLVLSLNTFADCVTVFNDGAQNYNKGGKAALVSQASFQEMKDLASAGASNEQMCNKGQEARMASFLAAKSYGRARESFLDAINECSTPNDQKASVLADKATTAYNSNADFVASMDNILGSQCGAKSLTPLLNE